MSSITIIYEAKFKYCKHIKYFQSFKKNGEISKREFAKCINEEYEGCGKPLTLKSRACSKFNFKY